MDRQPAVPLGGHRSGRWCIRPVAEVQADTGTNTTAGATDPPSSGYGPTCRPLRRADYRARLSTPASVFRRGDPTSARCEVRQAITATLPRLLHGECRQYAECRARQSAQDRKCDLVLIAAPESRSTWWSSG